MTLNFPDSPSTGDIYDDSTSGFRYEWNGTVWISTDPARAANIKELDDISSGFNGSTTQFNLRVSSSAVEPVSDAQILISVGGVMQNPTNDYTVVGSTITFTTAPSAGLTFFGVFLGQALSLNTVQDGSVEFASFKTGTAGVGIQSAGSQIGVGITNLNFIGTGNTFVAIGNTVNVSVNVGGIDTTGTSYFNNITASGNLNVTGDLTYDEVTAVNQKISGVTTTTGLDVLGISSVKDLRSVGVTTLTSAGITNLTVSAASTFTGAIDANGGADISGGSGLVASTAKVSDLTSGRVTYAGGSGELQDNAGLTFDGTTLASTRLAAPVAFTTSLTAANVDVTGITTIRDDLTLKGASANITFDKSTDDLIFADGAKAVFGTGLDLSIFHDSGWNYIQGTANSLAIQAKSGENSISAASDGNVQLYFDGTSKIQTTSVGVNVVGNVDCDSLNNAGITTFTGAATLNGNTTFGADVTFGGASSATALVWDKSVDDLIFADGAKAVFGTSSDGVEIYHDGSNSRIKDTGTGALKLSGSEIAFENAATNETLAQFFENGGVSLRYDNTERFQTKGDGINVTGNVDCDSLNNAGISTFAGDVYMTDTSSPLHLYGWMYFEATGDQGIYWNAGTGNGLHLMPASSSSLAIRSGQTATGLQLRTSGGTLRGSLYADNNNNIGFLDNGGNWALAIQRGSANAVLYDSHWKTDTDSTYDIGTNSVRWRNVYADTYYGDGSNLTGAGASIAPMAYNPPVSSSRPASTGIAFTFGSAIKAGSGNINIRQVSTSGTITQSFDVTDSSEVAFALKDLREVELLNVTELAPDSVYAIDIPATAIDDNTQSYVGTGYTFYTHASALALYTWGRNNTGQLGVPSVGTADRSSPILIPSASSTWKYLPQGNTEDAYQAGAIKADNTLWTWGYNQDGVLGQNQANAQLVQTSSPVQVPGTNWNGINSALIQNTWLACKTDGTLWAWGRNAYGQLGLNNRTEYSSPTQIPGTWGSTSVGNMISGNYLSSYGIKSNNTLWAWGYNSNHGQLGLNNKTEYSSPKQIPGTTWAKIGAFSYGAYGIKTDGTLWAWGSNDNGELGQGNRSEYSSPKQIPGTTWKMCNGGHQACVAVKTDGTLWTWGRNESGQLGINNRQSYSSPKQIPGTTWVAADTAGPNLNCLALKKDGTLWTWGSGSEGMTGQNQSAPTGGTRSSPVQIPGKWTTSMSGTLAQAQDGEQPFQINQNGSFLQALLYDLGG